jgi:hypothetical protein
MKISTFLKFIFAVIGVAIISVVSVLGVLYIDKNNLMEKALENSNTGLETHIASLHAKLDFFNTSSEMNNILIEDKETVYGKDREFYYINQGQIVYADKDLIRYVFNGKFLEFPYAIGLTKLKQYINKKDFVTTQTEIINKRAISKISRKHKNNENYSYHVKLVNSEEIEISRDTYNSLVKSNDLAETH